MCLGIFEKRNFKRGHSDLNQGPIDLQSIALPLSYTPFLNTVVLNLFLNFVQESENWYKQIRRKVYIQGP